MIKTKIWTEVFFAVLHDFLVPLKNLTRGMFF